MQDNMPNQPTTGLYGAGESKQIGGFSMMDNVPLPEPEWGRLLQRQSFTQQNVVQGYNKQIILNDGTSDRMLIGYSKNGF